MLFCGCSSTRYKTSEYIDVSLTDDMPVISYGGLAEEYAVVSYSQATNAADYTSTGSALLIDDSSNDTLVSYNPHAKIYPASMTKIMTGLLVMESIESGAISLDDVITLDHTITFDEANVGVSNLVGGCQVTVKNLLYGLLIKSYNDCAVILADYIAGSESAFVDMMNEKAASLGATNTHFCNPHGLHSEEHYTTAYDLYIIFKEFTSHDLAYVIDSMSSYDFTYIDADGVTQTVNISSTNGFLSGEYNLPDGYSLGSWKSGTTTAAGSCLIIEFVNDSSGRKYIAIVAKAESREALYQAMTSLINTAK
jgi:D-alanyl-D-alanine carboxypeptidase (penicillin-binding protein 5/6)